MKTWKMIPNSFKQPRIPKGSYLKIYFNIIYYLSFIPFKVNVDPKSNEYVLSTNWIQKFLCVVVNVSAILGSIAYYTINYSIFFNVGSNISLLFGSIGNLLGAVAALCTYNVLWFRQRDVLHFISESRVNKPIGNIRTVVLLITITMYMGQLGFTILPDTPLYIALTTTSQCIRKFVYENTSDPLLQQLLIIGTKFLDLCFVQGCALFIVPKLLITFASLQLKCLGEEFEELIESWDLSMKEVMLEYDMLRKKVECINSVLGETLLSVYVCILALLANLPGYLRDDRTSTVGVIYPLAYSAMIGITMIIGSDLPKRVRTCSKRWIMRKQFQHLSQAETNLLFRFSQEVDCGEPIGLSCSFFTVTYSFVGSMVSLLTTYGVIVFQMQK